ncbi:MAG TPA: hypothetical protein ENH10_02735 [Bacteroidetes bacterium]|nr:hypothetical protein BMS3Bbin04_01702 [bacterium BMS3Bbin04]HDO64932.1 hypothetical protein [Bacteroidota bacterium]HEX04057.1 hypothetical protein [Bacteroidota bacterium]
MQVDPRLEQFTALIEQQRRRQPAMRNSSTAMRLTSTAPINSINENATSGTGKASYAIAAEQARLAMTARNPALAEKLKQARMMLTTSGINGTMKTAGIESQTVIGRSGRPGSTTNVNDLQAVPRRSATAPGLGQNIDAYA